MPGYIVAISTPLETTGLKILDVLVQKHTLADITRVVEREDLPGIRVRLCAFALPDLSRDVTRDTRWLTFLANGMVFDRLVTQFVRFSVKGSTKLDNQLVNSVLAPA